MDKFDEKLDKIIIQTTEINARVSNLENWKKGIVKVFWVVIGFITTIVGYFFEKEINK
jgi:uncharacterized membrane protein